VACPYRNQRVRDTADDLGRAFVVLVESLRPVLEALAAIAAQNARLWDQLADGPDPWVVDDSE
jgi:hypothetical protein